VTGTDEVVLDHDDEAVEWLLRVRKGHGPIEARLAAAAKRPTPDDQERVVAACTCGSRSPRKLHHESWCASWAVPYTGEEG
jgi:hypothetical protein